ncbi:KGK domain-containing protein [Anabaena cylindrica UHCC 0172]|uniref:KGK domain-containing protein n=1 Tax=Anabaena cylindrica TaxID=1165 RepID=UPI002B1E98DF|nr:KGK domain-containing protein [Anabaena cylindrica]MEA5550288.1 KGK domain-containing protein [Anabaena cylindrica UHCC 0172]
MNNKYIPLNCEDDILSLGKDIFKISRFKELVIREVRENLILQICNSEQRPQGSIIQLFKTVQIGEEVIDINNIQFQFFKACQLLIRGSKNWQTGKLKVQISVSPLGQQADEVYIEFYSDELDELLALENLQHISKNMTYSKSY